MRRIAIMGAATLAAATAVTFAVTTLTAPPAAASELTPFKSCGELRNWYVDAALPRVTAWGWNGGVRMYATLAEAGAADLAGAPAAKDSTVSVQSNSATGTNVQEAGVDEPDYVKTDGSLLVRIVGSNRLVISDVSGSRPRELGRVDLPDDMYGNQLLLVGKTVVVSGSSIANVQGGPETKSSVGMLVPYTGNESRLVTISISDPTRPSVKSDSRVEGSILTMRQYGDVVRVVLTSALPQLDFVYPDKNTTEKQALAHNKQVVNNSTISDWLPTIRQTATGKGTALVACGDVSHPKKQSGFGTITIMAFAATNTGDMHTVAVTAGGNLVYSSADRLYLATTTWGWAIPMMAQAGVGVAEAPAAVDNGSAPDATAPDGTAPVEEPRSDASGSTGSGDATVVSPDQPTSEPGGQTEPGSSGGGTDSSDVATDVPGTLVAQAPKGVTTQIHAFALDGLDTTYLASGQVRGLIQDRWSMSEYNGDLRVAVGLGQTWNASDNGVTVLRDQGRKLVTVGRVRGLGTNERIQSVRWLGPLAVMVTFRQVDPLYTIDLTDPTNPTVLGELKIPGFSSYLHPIGNGRLVGIGQNATQTGRLKGGQAAVFDISDPTDPARLSTFSFGRSTQPVAGWEPKAFTYLPDTSTLLTSVWDSRGVATEYVLTVGSDGSLTETNALQVGTGDAQQVRALPISNGRVALVNGLSIWIVPVG